MSAAPRPTTDDTSDAADAEGWALLEGLRRRLDEQANQNRKTQTQVTQLADSIAALVAGQRKRARWLNVNSFAAYLIFTLLCGGAFYFLYQSRARELERTNRQVIEERDSAVKHSKMIADKLAARDAGDLKAWDAYVLLESGKREEAAKKLAELERAPLSKFERTVLDARAKQAEVMQVDAALKGATAAVKAGRYADVVAPLEAAIALESVGPRAALMHYYLGVAYAKSGALDSAVVHLQAAVDGEVDVEDARFHLASALDRAGQWGKARVEYERFATAHPMSSYTAFATRRGYTLSRAPAVAPTKPAAAAPPAAATGAPPQAAPAGAAQPVTAEPPPPPTLQPKLPAAPMPKAVPAPTIAPQPKAPAQPMAQPTPPAAPVPPPAALQPKAPAVQPKIAPGAPQPKAVAQPKASPQPKPAAPQPKVLDFSEPGSANE